MKTFTYNPVDITPDLLEHLEERDLVKRLHPSSDMLNKDIGSDKIETIYTSDILYGSQKLICVRKTITDIQLTSHPDNEIFIILNPLKVDFKPLYLVIGLIKHNELQMKISDNSLSQDDIMVLRLHYNDPETSFFILLKDTPHWELTAPGKGKAPVFFVAEPTDLKMDYVNLESYTIEISQ